MGYRKWFAFININNPSTFYKYSPWTTFNKSHEVNSNSILWDKCEVFSPILNKKELIYAYYYCIIILANSIFIFKMDKFQDLLTEAAQLKESQLKK